MSVSAIPEGYHSITPYLIVSNAAEAIEFYKKAFDAIELMRLPGPGGKVMHAEIKIGDSPIMMADEFPEMGASSPTSIGGSATSLCFYVEDVDSAFKQALAAGATEQRPVVDQFYGDRSGTLIDPFGHVWTIATHIEDLSAEEIELRMQQSMG